METTSYLDINNAAEFLNMSVAWLRAQVLNRRIPFYKFGRCVRFSKSELDTYIERRKHSERSMLSRSYEQGGQSNGR